MGSNVENISLINKDNNDNKSNIELGKKITTNYLSSGQKRIYKLISENGTIKSAADDPNLFVRYSSWKQMQSEKKLNNSLYTFNTLVKELLNEVETDKQNNDIYKEVDGICTEVEKLVKGTECDLLKKNIKEFVPELDRIFNIINTNTNKINPNKLAACGVYNSLYRKVVAMMKNLNPVSRKTKTRSRKTLKKYKEGSGKVLTSTRAKDYSKTEKSTAWIEDHLDYSLLLCCIDKVCYITSGSTENVAAKINGFMKGISINLDYFTPVAGGTIMSFLTSIRFYYAPDETKPDGARKIKLILRREEEGNFYFDCTIETAELNINNERYRANNSLTEDKIPYQVYIYASTSDTWDILGKKQ